MTAMLRVTASDQLEAVAEGIALVDEDRVDAVLARPAGDTRLDRLHAAHLGRALDPPLEEAADEALMDEIVTDLELPLRCEMRHARRGTGAAGRTVDPALAKEDRVPGVRRLVPRRACPHDVADALDARIFGMDQRHRLVGKPADHRAHLQ